MSSNWKPDIIWILIDGIRPDKLWSCGNLDRPTLFIDKILLSGTLFTNVITPGACTKVSMYAAFTSLYPSINKMNAYNPKLMAKFDPLTFTLPDLLLHNGYKTFRYQDAVLFENNIDKFQFQPSSGFLLWESSGYGHIDETPNNSYSTPRRNAFITKFNKCSSPKFAYIHLLTSHDINRIWLSDPYERNLFKISEDFEDVWNKLHITDSTLVIVSTDHGARLDIKLKGSDVDLIQDDPRDYGDRLDLKYFFQEEQLHGLKLRDISMKTFCSFIGYHLPKKIIDKMVRTIDIVPTILEITGCPQILGQGISLVPLIKEEDFPEVCAFMEAGGINQKPPCLDGSDVWGIRTDRWKYWCHARKGEWLIDLKNDHAEEINLIGAGFPVENRLRELVRKYRNETRTPEQIYAENAKARDTSTYFNKRQIVPEISLFLLIQDKNPHLIDVVDSILAQICVYFELIIVDTTSNGSAKSIVERYSDYRMRYCRIGPNIPLTSIFGNAKGKYISCLAPDVIYNPYLLYELRNILRDNSKIALVHSDWRYIDQVGLDGFERTVNAKKIFNEKNNIGYCFLVRKEKVSNTSDSGINVFNDENLYIPLVKGSLISYSQQSLGSKRYKAGYCALGLHICLYMLHKLVDKKRRESWRIVTKNGMKFLWRKMVR